jgi:hypothetical protein
MPQKACISLLESKVGRDALAQCFRGFGANLASF